LAWGLQALRLYGLALDAGHPLAAACHARLKARMPKIHARARVSMSVREKLAVERHRDAVLAREKELEVRRERFVVCFALLLAAFIFREHTHICARGALNKCISPLGGPFVAGEAPLHRQSD
jgi:hypothetical protein